jgi:glutamate receptor, ionotropic, invertebrate
MVGIYVIFDTDITNIKYFRLPLVEYVLKNYKRSFTVTVRELDITINKNFRPQLRRVKQSNGKNILLCSSIEDLAEILKQAQQVGLMTDEHQFILTSLDMHTVDLEPFQYSGANITGFRMVDPVDSFVEDIMEKVAFEYKNDFEKDFNWKEGEMDLQKRNEEMEMPIGLTSTTLQMSTALTFDALLLFHHVMKHHQAIQVQSLQCSDRKSSFISGTSIFNSMKTIPPFKGLSGDVQFDQHGNRENFNLDILELASDGLKKIGTWNATKGITSLKGKPVETVGNPDSLVNKTLIVLTVIVRDFHQDND